MEHHWVKSDTIIFIRTVYQIRFKFGNGQVNLARRQGMAVTTETKYGAGGNTQVPAFSKKNTSFLFQKGTSLNTAKLEQETEELSHKKVNITQ